MEGKDPDLLDAVAASKRVSFDRDDVRVAFKVLELGAVFAKVRRDRVQWVVPDAQVDHLCQLRKVAADDGLQRCVLDTECFQRFVWLD